MGMAHTFLTEMRNRHRDTQDTDSIHDLTHDAEFDWRAWISQRPDAWSIIGPGIYAFGFMWVSSEDTNLREKRGSMAREGSRAVCSHGRR